MGIIDEILDSIPLKRSKIVEDRIVFATRVIDILKEKKLKRKDLAEKLGVKRPTISRMLSGTQNISLERISEIRVVLGISMTDIFHNSL